MLTKFVIKIVGVQWEVTSHPTP